jgi:hypothetical protein
MSKWLRNKWGYIPIAAGFILIAVGVEMLLTHIVLNTEHDPNWYLWFYWAPIVTTLLIAGAICTTTGLIIKMKIKGNEPYALVAGGFLLIIFDSYLLIGVWVRKSDVFTIDYFYASQSVVFFSGLVAGIFLVVLGIMIGSKIKNRWSITSIAGGSAVLFLAFCLITLNFLATIAIDPVFGLSAFRWYFFWENFTPVIPIFLVIGGALVVSGVLLMRKRKQATA